MLLEYQDIFSTGDGDLDLGRTGVVKHRIKTRKGEVSIRGAQRALSMDSYAVWVVQCAGDVRDADGEHNERAAMANTHFLGFNFRFACLIIAGTRLFKSSKYTSKLSHSTQGFVPWPLCHSRRYCNRSRENSCDRRMGHSNKCS